MRRALPGCLAVNEFWQYYAGLVRAEEREMKSYSTHDMFVVREKVRQLKALNAIYLGIITVKAFAILVLVLHGGSNCGL